jgi:hypothetical protein
MKQDAEAINLAVLLPNEERWDLKEASGSSRSEMGGWGAERPKYLRLEKPSSTKLGKAQNSEG